MNIDTGELMTQDQLVVLRARQTGKSEANHAIAMDRIRKVPRRLQVRANRIMSKGQNGFMDATISEWAKRQRSEADATKVREVKAAKNRAKAARRRNRGR